MVQSCLVLSTSTYSPSGDIGLLVLQNQMCYLLSIKENQFVLLGIVVTINMVSKTVKLKSG